MSTLRVALGDDAPLVAALAAACEGDLDFHAAVLEVHARRDERQALLAHLPVQRVDLAAMQEELAIAVGLVPQRPCLRVLGDRRADEPRLAVADVGVCLPELNVAVRARTSPRSP